MNTFRKIYLGCLVCTFLYTIIRSYLNVLDEPTTFEETEVKYHSTFPSITICPKQRKQDDYKTFSDLVKAIDNFKERTFATFGIDGLGVQRKEWDLKNSSVLQMEFNQTLDSVWTTSAIVQPDFTTRLTPCVTLNIPFIKPPKQGRNKVSLSRWRKKLLFCEWHSHEQ